MGISVGKVYFSVCAKERVEYAFPVVCRIKSSFERIARLVSRISQEPRIIRRFHNIYIAGIIDDKIGDAVRVDGYTLIFVRSGVQIVGIYFVLRRYVEFATAFAHE